MRPTDYYIIRANDPSSESLIPEEIIALRAQIRADILTNENAINALESIDEVVNFELNWTEVED